MLQLVREWQPIGRGNCRPLFAHAMAMSKIHPLSNSEEGMWMMLRLAIKCAPAEY